MNKIEQSFPIFVINLPIDKDRRAAIERRLHVLGARYEVVDGVYGDDARVIARYDQIRAIKEHGKPLVFGERGCALAHVLVHERIIRENIPYALILEDDILLPDNFIEIVQKEIDKKRKNWDWLSFDYRYVGPLFFYHWIIASIRTTRKNPPFFFYALAKAPYMAALSIFEGARDIIAKIVPSYAGAKRFYRPLYNAGAYVLTLDGAKKMLPFTKPLRLTADQLPNVVRFKTNFNLYGYVPLMVRQNTVDYETQAGKDEEEWKKIKR